MGLIRNADDFGKNESVNRAIQTCFQKGYIDRTTLMVNMPDAAQAVEIAKKEGFFDRVGIHLNLTEGMPLTQPIRSNPLLCDATGRFHAAFRQTTKYRLYMDQLSEEQIFTELDAQLQQYANWGFPLFHVDSHHHVHTDVPVYGVLKKLSRKYRFSSVRLSRNLYRGGNPLTRIYKGFYNRSVARLCDTTTDLFGSFEDLTGYGTWEQNRILCEKKQIEIMLHPMYDAQDRLVDTQRPMDEVQDYLNRVRN